MKASKNKQRPLPCQNHAKTHEKGGVERNLTKTNGSCLLLPHSSLRPSTGRHLPQEAEEQPLACFSLNEKYSALKSASTGFCSMVWP